MRKLKISIIFIFLFSFSLTVYGSDMKPTEEEKFVYSFITNLYTFDNNSLKNLSFYKFMYPMDKYTLNLRNFMPEKTFDAFVKENQYYDFIISSYSHGFDSSVHYVNLTPSKKQLDKTTYNYTATVELFYGYKSQREIYQVTGELQVSKVQDEYKIAEIESIKFPSTGASNIISDLV